MSYIQNTPFQSNSVFLNTNNSKKQDDKYTFNLDSSLRCPLNTNFVVSVQDFEIPNTFNNITANNNRLQFKIRNLNFNVIDFAGAGLASFSAYTTFLTNNNFDFWTVDTAHTTVVINGSSYKPVSKNGTGTGYIRRYLPNYNGYVQVRFKNNSSSGLVEGLVGGTIKKSLAPNTEGTMNASFTNNQILQLQEKDNGQLIILSITIYSDEPTDQYPYVIFPPNYYSAYTFRDYFNANFASQNPTITDTISLEYDKTQYKFNFSGSEYFFITNQERLHKDLDFGGLTTTALFDAFCNANNLGNNNLVTNTTGRNQIQYPILDNPSLPTAQTSYPLPNYSGKLTIRIGLAAGTGGIKLSLNNVQQGSLITDSDIVRTINFTANQVLRIERDNNKFVLYSIDVVETNIETITNPCDVIGLNKDNDRNFIFPINASSDPQWTIRMPSIVNFLPTTHIFIKFQDIALNNLNSLGNSDNTLVRIPVNSPRGSIIYYRPTESIRFIIPKKRISNFNLSIQDANNNELDLGGLDFQLTLRFDYYYPEELKDLEEGSINHTLKLLSKELPDEEPKQEQGLG